MQPQNLSLIPREPAPYSIKSTDYWCHVCRKQFSKLNIDKQLDTFCPICNCISEEISKDNDPKSFQIYNPTNQAPSNQNPNQNYNQNTNQNQRNTNGICFFESFSQGPNGNIRISRSYSPMNNNNSLFDENFFGNHANHTTHQNSQQNSNQNSQQNFQNNFNIENDLFNEPFATLFGGFSFSRNSTPSFLNQIFEMLGRNQEHQGAPPASEKALKKINVTKINEDNKEKYEKEVCAVCQETYKYSDNIAILNCKHNFHENCVMPWLKMHRTCPVCRVEVKEN